MKNLPLQKSMSCFLISLFLLFETSLASCKYKFIHNASEFIEFSNETNSGITYSDYTVYLVNDIIFNDELSRQFIPPYGFLGTFDGQGYVVSNLTITSSLSRVGLFAASSGITIKNVVVDKSCSISTSYSSSSFEIAIGGILSNCYTSTGSCIIENSVNMANLSSIGNAGYMYLGGIVGVIRNAGNSYEGKVQNCVNYGSI